MGPPALHLGARRLHLGDPPSHGAVVVRRDHRGDDGRGDDPGGVLRGVCGASQGEAEVDVVSRAEMVAAVLVAIVVTAGAQRF